MANKKNAFHCRFGSLYFDTRQLMGPSNSNVGFEVGTSTVFEFYPLTGAKSANLFGTVIALLSQAKQSIIGARFAHTKFSFSFRRVGSLFVDLIVSPTTVFQSHPPPFGNTGFDSCWK
jgi:hypothetical protein